jgi:hypothetical protein
VPQVAGLFESLLRGFGFTGSRHGLGQRAAFPASGASP